MKLAELKPSFYEMLLVDFIAERVPRTRSPDMGLCRKLAKNYLKKFPDSLSKAIEMAEGNIERVMSGLEPPFLAWARKEIPDLLEKPAGMY